MSNTVCRPVFFLFLSILQAWRESMITTFTHDGGIDNTAMMFSQTIIHIVSILQVVLSKKFWICPKYYEECKESAVLLCRNN